MQDGRDYANQGSQQGVDKSELDSTRTLTGID
jgi:hypothetical protein